MNDLSSIFTQILYDKIIDVDLLWTESMPIDSVILVPGKSFIKRGEITIDNSWTTLLRLPGYTHRENTADEYGNLISSVVSAVGPVYRYRLTNPEHKANFDMGRRPDGSYLQAGDKLLVNDGGRFSTYHIIEQKDPSTTKSGAEYTVTNRISIKCPRQGRKPGISFSVNLLQGMNCYEMTLKICNLNLDVDIRKITRVEVKAGYRTEGFTQTFNCPVFSSYIESPNPDGVTVFKCLAVGTTNVFTESRPFSIHYLGGSVTVGKTIEAVSLGVGLTPRNLLLPEYNDLEIKMTAMNTVAENASALIDWLRKVVTQRIALADGERGTDGDPQVIVQQDTNRNLFVYCANRKNVEDKNGITTPVLDAVKGASFNGVALTVKAAWNPTITPGTTFIMKPSIINGANLPNVLSEYDYGNEESRSYKYRCITASISFSTTGSENEMSILAIPIKYMDTDTSSDPSVVTIEKMAQTLYNRYKVKVKYEISLGSADASNLGAKSADQKVVTTQEVASRNMFDIDTKLVFGDIQEYMVVKGDCMSEIAKKFYVNGNRCYAPRIDIPKKGKEPDLSVLTDSTKYIGDIGAQHLWPLIAVHTYNQYKLAEQAQAALNKYESFKYIETNPNYVSEGKIVTIPRINSLDDIKPLRNIFKYAAETYKDVEGYSYFIEAWTALYYYLGGS